MTCHCGKPASITVQDEHAGTTREVCYTCAYAILNDAVASGACIDFAAGPGRVELLDPAPAYSGHFAIDYSDER